MPYTTALILKSWCGKGKQQRVTRILTLPVGRDEPICMLLLKVNFIKGKRLHHKRALFIVADFERKQSEEWVSQLDMCKHKLRFKPQSLNKGTWLKKKKNEITEKKMLSILLRPNKPRDNVGDFKDLVYSHFTAGSPHISTTFSFKSCCIFIKFQCCLQKWH